MFAREGYTIIAGVTVLAVLLALLGVQLGMVWRVPLVALAVGLMAFTLYFFRDPERTPPAEAAEGNLLLAPADGRVVEIIEEDEPLYLNGPSKRISIFLSPLNVHVNRIPADGVMEYVEYRPGDYLVAWHPKASEKNERSELGLQRPNGDKVLFKQIAGAVARRIEYHVKEGDAVQAGARFGIVKFGSRMDVHVPPHATITVEKGDKVRAGESILGRFPDEPTSDAPAAASASTAVGEAAPDS